VHPAVVDAYLKGGNPAGTATSKSHDAVPPDPAAPPTPAEERQVLALLRSRRARH
jgi:hypothetical protein